MKPGKLITAKMGWDTIPQEMGNGDRFYHPSTCAGCGCVISPLQITQPRRGQPPSGRLTRCRMTLRIDQLGIVRLCPYCDPKLREEWEFLNS